MSDRLTCHHCSVSFKIESRAGGKLMCPFCGALLAWPGHSGGSGILSASKSSLATHVPMAPCPACGKNNLAGIPNCYHCGVTLPPLQEPGVRIEESGSSHACAPDRRLPG
jgi:hypothetical protein